LKAAARLPLKDECAEARAAYDAPFLAKGVSQAALDQWREGVLTSDAPLVFDDFGDATVGDVLADPDRYVGETLADPIEGIEYGADKAKMLRRPDGEVFIKSFAHGGQIYRLRHDRTSIEKRIGNADKAEAAQILCALATADILNPIEEKSLVKKVADRMDTGIREVAAMLKQAQQKKQRERVKTKREARAAASSKTVLMEPHHDAEIGPVMAKWDGILSAAKAAEPPMRDLSGWPVHVREREPMGRLHGLTSKGANDEEVETSRLPPPKQILLTRHDAYSVEHEIGNYITLFRETKGDDIRVCPERRFIDHWLHYEKSKLPKVGMALTMPLVLEDGTLLSKNGLDRDRKLVMRCDEALLAYIPQRSICDDDAVREAFRFLDKEWLVDVAADHRSKCVLLAYALSVIECALFDSRPIFTVTASQRSSGKTTALQMLIQGALGRSPSASAWAKDEDERRKTVLGYLIEGLPTIIWDNIPLGESFRSAIIEEICTAESHSDRLLGVTQNVTVPCFTINAFTGNNIQAAGDLASRCLEARLSVDRPDPQNRTFVHVDPIKWTLDHRGSILKALYTILLGNPQLTPARAVEPKTRFKKWWTLIGSAVEHASKLYVEESAAVDFAAMFDEKDEEDDMAIEIREVLEILAGPDYWSGDESFTATQVYNRLNDTKTNTMTPDSDITVMRDFFSNSGRTSYTAVVIGRALKAARDRPYKLSDGSVISLQMRDWSGTRTFCIKHWR
jgi:hypothetical protein